MYYLLLLLLLSSCSSENERHLSGEYIVRLHDEYALQIEPPQPVLQPPYPWEQEGRARPISKEFFRCKGSSLNPPHIVMKNGKEVNRFYDCSGAEKHSLPLRDEKEFIYPILIDLLNHVQKVTSKAVIVTSGHRCIAHQAFMDPTPRGSSSKHLIGAEVDFYVLGLEEQPQKIAQILMDYYKEQEKDYKTFQKFEKPTDVSTQPVYNKEIFIKIYKKSEGRNYDNRHPYPYVSLQVRFDREKNERVTFVPEAAYKLLRK